jgi:toxin ParE1/3/4
MVKLRWLQSAKDDLKNIYDFIAADSKKYALHQINVIREGTYILKTQPNAGKVVSEYSIESIREIVVGHYRVIYRIINEELIHIILIHHGARRFPRISD